MQDDVGRFYDLSAQEIADAWYPNEILLPTIQDFISLLPASPRVLDLGCGGGYESKRLAAVGAQVVGVDFSEESIRIARERTPECQFEVLDFRQLDGRFGSFDGVFACASLIHVSPDELGDVMRRIAGVLKRDGCLLATVRDGEGIRETWPVVAGHKIRRVVYRYQKAHLASAAPHLEYLRAGYLDPELIEQGWRCHIFRVKRAHG